MNIAIIGCGFVADFYMQSLSRYPVLKLVAIHDRDGERLTQFSTRHGLDALRRGFDDILADRSIGMVLNLTNPDQHYTVSRAALEAGKHVYSEKPIAMSLADAEALTALAAERGLMMASAPCSLLGETAQALWRALRERRVGKVGLVYAELDDGLVHKMPYRKWLSDSGRPWPWKDEFEVGCTLEHAGYYVSWLTAFFGPAVSVSGLASTVYPDKETDGPLDRITPDFSCALIAFENGVVARLTCSIVAPHDQRLRFFGDTGVLETDHSWHYRQPVKIQRYLNIRRKMILHPIKEKVALADYPNPVKRQRGSHPMEFCRGPAEMAAAFEAGKPSPLPPDWCLHNNEVVLAIQQALEGGGHQPIKTRFQPLAPPAWAG